MKTNSENMFSGTNYKQILSEALDDRVNRLKTIKQRGGQRVFDIELTHGDRMIVKYASGEEDIEMLEAELHGLELMSESNTVHIPSVKRYDDATEDFFFVMDYVEEDHATEQHWENFATELSKMHQKTNEAFGLNRDNYIGQMPQLNDEHDTWADFYAEERLIPEMQWALDSGLHDNHDSEMLEDLCNKLTEICPEEQPALTHGDMWSGNILPSSGANIYLIDPAVSYAHREMDIAMSKLFGGIPLRFYNSYQAIYPMEGGWQSRMDVYQLYYLLVHVNMFGRSYVGQVRNILNKYS